MKHYICLILIALLCFSCNSQKRMARKAAPAPAPIVQEPETLTVSAPKLRITVNYQERTISSQGTLTWVRDSIAILSLQPLLGLELLRVEMTPATLTIIDKMNRRYAILTPDEVRSLVGRNVSFAALQTEALQLLHDSPAPYHVEQAITKPLAAAFTVDMPTVLINQQVNASPSRLSAYQKTNITTILSGK